MEQETPAINRNFLLSCPAALPGRYPPFPRPPQSPGIPSPLPNVSPAIQQRRAPRSACQKDNPPRRTAADGGGKNSAELPPPTSSGNPPSSFPLGKSWVELRLLPPPVTGV